MITSQHFGNAEVLVGVINKMPKNMEKEKNSVNFA